MSCVRGYDRIVNRHTDPNAIDHVPQMLFPPPHNQTLSAQLDIDPHSFR
jgi:hypothetical protein